MFQFFITVAPLKMNKRLIMLNWSYSAYQFNVQIHFYSAGITQLNETTSIRTITLLALSPPHSPIRISMLRIERNRICSTRTESGARTRTHYKQLTKSRLRGALSLYQTPWCECVALLRIVYPRMTK